MKLRPRARAMQSWRSTSPDRSIGWLGSPKAADDDGAGVIRGAGWQGQQEAEQD